ncbi:MAG: M42 family metallopeptidase [Clostridiales bacterium]|jgi:putative aminopeptidase FrvX|nr:M42 family metallopeptidase [Clostridiales bacterium]
MLDLLRQMSEIISASGKEKCLRDFIIERIKPHAEYEVDPLGNLLVFKKGKNRAKNKVMLAAHIDEVGIIVCFAEKSGFLRFATVGGIDPKVLLGREIVFENGVKGVTGLAPVHLLKEDEKNKAPEISDLYIDIGANSDTEALNAVPLGTTGTFAQKLEEFGDGLVAGRALDDRIGAAIMLDLIRSETEYDLTLAFTVQEEVGARGAAAAAFSIAPDYAIVLEATTAADIIDVPEHKQVCKLKNGAAVSFMDNSTVYPMELYELALKVAEDNGIKAQPKAAVAGGNDSGSIHKSGKGVRTITLSVPCRYIHSQNCVSAVSDIYETRALAEKLGYTFANA